MIGIIVFIHEGGHFLAARLMKVRVREFMFGLPGPSIGFTFRKTRYGVTAIPLGGYCLIAGEGGAENPNLAEAYSYLAYWGTLSLEEAEKSSEALGFDLVSALNALESWMTIKGIKGKAGSKKYEMLATTIDGVEYAQGAARPVSDINAAKAHIDKERTHTYAGKSWWRRVVILLGGSFMNLLFAIIVITSVIMALGTMSPTTTIERVVENSPAYEAGLVSGDVLLSVNGRVFETWQDFFENVDTFKVGDVIELGYSHEGVVTSTSITLADNDGRPYMGVTSRPIREQVPFFEALGVTFSLIGIVTQAISQLFNPATFSETVGQSSSVVGIAVEAEKAATSGALYFIVLAAELSISIGLLNLAPIPPLDGGKIVVETIQRVTRRIIPARVISAISITAMILLLLLFIVLTNQDINRYFLGG